VRNSNYGQTVKSRMTVYNMKSINSSASISSKMHVYENQSNIRNSVSKLFILCNIFGTFLVSF